jgi:trimeric autotransporter adhesin
MKKLLLLSLAMIVIQVTFGQLTGTKTIPGDYATIEAAISALNAQGAGTGGVTFNVAAGHTETLTSPTAGTITTNTGTSANQIIFQKSGAGANPVITAAVLASASATDGIIKIAGSDYITFDGINLQENAANTTNLTDWGYAVLKESASNGAQNITIKNCTITLNKVNTSSVGIYMHNHTATSTTVLTGITSLAGTNSYNKIFSNTISNAYNAIYVYGFSDVSPYAYYDQNNEIGVNGGNMISDFGGAATTIYGIYTINQNNLQVSNNMLTGTIGGTTTTYGIYTSTAVNANTTISGNSIIITFTGTTQTLYGIYNAAGGTGTNNTINVTGNTVSLNYSTATTGAIYAVYQSASCYNFNCSNNNVTNNILGSASTAGTGTFGGLYTFGTNSNAGSLWIINNNNISGNVRAQSAAGSGTNYYMYNSSSGVTCNINNNILTNNTATSTGTTYCIYTSSSATTKNIFDNEISNLLNSSGTVYGIYNSSGTTINIYRNKVLNINSNVAASAVHGIYVSSGTNGYVFNNFVSELKTPLATGNPAVYGLNIAGGTNMFAYYNTIYLNATSSGATFGSAGLYTSTAPTVDLRNNLVVNVSTPGATGRTVAFQRSNATLTTYSNVSNNNNFFAGTPGASNLIYYDATNSDQTLAAFKARVSPRDASSVTENPPFVNVTTPPYNLHIQTTINSQLESGGTTVSTPISIVDDYDVQARYPNAGYPNNAGSPASAPDIGADEFGGLALDMTPPNIAFTPFVNTSGTGARTLTTTITDATGVPVAGAGLPVLYWKINSGAYSPVTATYVSGSTYTFTFGTGVVLGDVISYYIVAQDLVTPTPNVGANPSGGASGFTVNPPACSTPPTTPYSYIIVGALCGNYNVGAGQVYPTLTAAVADLNLKEITCPVTFTLTDANYSAGETFPLVINAMAGASAVNTVTIKPAAGVAPLISGNSATSIFKFNGTQYLTIDQYGNNRHHCCGLDWQPGCRSGGNELYSKELYYF